VCDPDGQPTAVQFWDDTGAYLDFTHPATIEWWKARVTDSLLAHGIAATWNDNNEFEIWSDQARVHGFGDERAAIEARPLQTLLMIQASRAAQVAFAPNERPLLISRSGAAGMQRYVQTWSGDNYTAWETLRYNIRMGLGLAMSGVSNTGHDIGGFSGPAPDPELFVRWVQHGIFLPRFSIHSWNDDKSVNEPWMYPEHTAQVRDLIKLRCRLMPYLYDLVWRSHSFYEPIIRPTFYDFPDDAHCYDENDDSMLGAALLVPSVVEPGQTERRVRLPKGADWFDVWTGERHAGGRSITLAAPLAGPPPLLARAGSAIPLNVAEARFGSRDDQRGFHLFPLDQGRFEASCFEDDGASHAWRDGDCFHWRLGVECSAHSIAITVERDGHQPGSEVDLVLLLLPAGERRVLAVDGATVLSDAPAAAGRQAVVRVGSERRLGSP
jgi:alpha-glucosidase